MTFTTNQVYLGGGAAVAFNINTPAPQSGTPYMALPFADDNSGQLVVQWFSVVTQLQLGQNPATRSLHMGVQNTDTFGTHFHFEGGALS